MELIYEKPIKNNKEILMYEYVQFLASYFHFDFRPWYNWGLYLDLDFVFIYMFGYHSKDLFEYIIILLLKY